MHDQIRPQNNSIEEGASHNEIFSPLSKPQNVTVGFAQTAKHSGILIHHYKIGTDTILQVCLTSPLGGAKIGDVSINMQQVNVDDVLEPIFTNHQQDIFAPITLLNTLLENADNNLWSIQSDLAEGRYEIISKYAEVYLSNLKSSEISLEMGFTSYGNNIFHLALPNHLLMTLMFLRFQEHYESPQFGGKVFTLHEYKDWYRSTQEHGQFSYYNDWGGFNIPSFVFEPFYKGAFDPLSSAERALLSRLPHSSGAKYYVIATVRDTDLSTLRHELAHGLYFVNGSYRAEVQEVLDSINLTPVEQFLRESGYSQSVFRDECHAYLGDPLDELHHFLRDVDISSYAGAHAQLNEIFNRHLPCERPGI